MDHANLVAIDIHTHAEVSCWNPFDSYGEEYDRAADKYFRNSKRPTIEETIAYYRERKKASSRATPSACSDSESGGRTQRTQRIRRGRKRDLWKF